MARTSHSVIPLYLHEMQDRGKEIQPLFRLQWINTTFKGRWVLIRESLIKYFDNQIVSVKWPNDIYVDGKKICGILIETHPANGQTAIIGVGMNFRNSLASAPPEIQKSATSLIDCTGLMIDSETMLVGLLQKIEEAFQELASSPSLLIDRFRNHCYLTDKEITIDVGPSRTTGLCLGIDDDGVLRIQCHDGVQRFLAGSVTVNRTR